MQSAKHGIRMPAVLGVWPFCGYGALTAAANSESSVLALGAGIGCHDDAAGVASGIDAGGTVGNFALSHAGRFKKPLDFGSCAWIASSTSADALAPPDPPTPLSWSGTGTGREGGFGGGAHTPGGGSGGCVLGTGFGGGGQFKGNGVGAGGSGD